MSNFFAGVVIGMLCVAGLFTSAHVQKVDGLATVQCAYNNCIKINNTTLMIK